MAESQFSPRDWRAHWRDAIRRSGEDNVFGQVERTVGGRPAPPDQIVRLARHVAETLALGADDVLVDLCCGNGLVTVLLAPLCRSIIAADYSPDLIRVAQQRCAAPNVTYLQRAAGELSSRDFPDGPPAKVCMNQGLQYFDGAMLDQLLESLEALGAGAAPILFTDVPDVDRIYAFYDTPERREELERRRAAGTEAIGAWWSRAQLQAHLARAGRSARFLEPDPARGTAHYRFDVLAEPSPSQAGL